MTEPALGVARSLSGRRWIWRAGEDRIAFGIAQRMGVPEIVGRMLAARGVGIEGAPDFLEPTLRALLPDPSLLVDMDPAAERLADAVARGETVAVFGDYDVDGACSAALMVTLLRDLGCTVHCHVPDRMKEGYGPNLPALGSIVRDRRVPAYNLGDDANLPPPLREQAYGYKPIGRSHDPRAGIIKDTPGPLTIPEMAAKAGI